MFLKYELDIGEHSIWEINTPTAFAQKLPFYLNECGRFLARENYYTIREGKMDYLFVYTLSGEGGLRYKEKTQALTANKAVIVDCQLRSHFFARSEMWDYYWMHFNGSAVEGIMEILSADSSDSIEVFHTESISTAMESMFKYLKHNDVESNINISEAISSVMCELIRCEHSPRGKAGNSHTKDMIRVIDFLRENYQNKISIDDMLPFAHMAKFHFIRSFKKHAGLTPYEYVLTLRITNAKRLLRETDESIFEIARIVGFADSTNFIRKFKKLGGVTPLQYRRMHM